MRRLFAVALAALLPLLSLVDPAYAQTTIQNPNNGSYCLLGNTGCPGLPLAGLSPSGTNLTVPTDTKGALQVNTEGLKASYSLAVTGLTASSGTPVIQMQGSSTKTIRITKIIASAYATTGTGGSAIYIMRTTATATGSSTSPSIVQMDSTDAVASATPLQFASGTVNSGTIFESSVIGQSSSTLVVSPYIWTAAPNTREFILRGTGQFLNVLFSIGSATNAFVDVTIYWTEE